MKKALLALAVAGGAATSASAQFVDIQFIGGNYGNSGPAQTGPALIGADGDLWNTFAQGTTSGSGSLTDVAGNPTGWNLTWNADGGYSNIGANNNPNAFYPGPYGNLMNSFLYTQGTGTVQITGVPQSPFNLYLYTDSNQNGRQVTLSVYTGAAFDSLLDSTTTAGSDTSSSNFVQGTNYVEFTNVTPDASGNLEVAFTNAAGEGDFNGLQIQPAAAPEPASATLLLLGFVALVSRRSRVR